MMRPPSLVHQGAKRGGSLSGRGEASRGEARVQSPGLSSGRSLDLFPGTMRGLEERPDVIKDILIF